MIPEEACPLPEYQKIPGCEAALLIGGRSSRMGCDKALLETADGPLFAAIAKQLQTRFKVVRPIGELPQDLPDVAGLHLPPAAPDVLAERSSLNGVLTALDNSACPWTAIFACDSPNVCFPLLVHMARLRRGDADVIAVSDRKGEIRPFHALWHVRCAAVLRDATDRKQLSLSEAMRKLSVTVIPPHEWQRFDPEGSFLLSLKTPGELEAYLESTGAHKHLNSAPTLP